MGPWRIDSGRRADVLGAARVLPPRLEAGVGRTRVRVWPLRVYVDTEPYGAPTVECAIQERYSRPSQCTREMRDTHR